MSSVILPHYSPLLSHAGIQQVRLCTMSTTTRRLRHSVNACGQACVPSCPAHIPMHTADIISRKQELVNTCNIVVQACNVV